MKIEHTEDSRFVCRPQALSVSQRESYSRLTGLLDLGNRRRIELADGLAFELPDPQLAIDAAEWMTYERLCCPFFSLSLEVGPGQLPRIALRGPEGIEAFIRAEFGLQ